MPPTAPTSSSKPAHAAPADPELWVDQYGDLLLRYALGRLADRDAAEDLVQETFLAAWRSRDKFHGDAKFETWLVGILRNKIRDRFRRGGRNAVSLDDAARQPGADGDAGSLFDSNGHWRRRIGRWSAPPDQAAETSEFWTVVRQCFSELPRHLADALRLKIVTDESNQAISEELGVTPTNLSVRLHRARMLLRDCLDRKWFDND